MSTATAGRAREYKVRDEMIAGGWELVMRAAASKGCADLAMVSPLYGLALVQVGTASKSIGPADRERFVRAANLCSALPILAVAGGRKPTRYWLVDLGPAGGWQEWYV